MSKAYRMLMLFSFLLFFVARRANHLRTSKNEKVSKGKDIFLESVHTIGHEKLYNTKTLMKLI